MDISCGQNIYKPMPAPINTGAYMPFNVSVDKEACIGCGACVAQCPDNFELKDGKAVPINTKVDDAGCNNDAADVCPADAIKVTEA